MYAPPLGDEPARGALGVGDRSREQIDDADADGELGAGDLDRGDGAREHAQVGVGEAVEGVAEHHAAGHLDPRDHVGAVDPRRERARQLALGLAPAAIGIVLAEELGDLGQRNAARTAGAGAVPPRRCD